MLLSIRNPVEAHLDEQQCITFLLMVVQGVSLINLNKLLLNVECLVWMSETTNVTNLKKE
jgi:hypothetical protein